MFLERHAHADRDLEARLASVSPADARILPENLALEFSALALGAEGERLHIAFTTTPTAATLGRIARATGFTVVPVLMPAHLVLPEIARCYGTVASATFEPGDDAHESSTVMTVDLLIRRSILARASDVHLSWRGGELRARLRVDGRLHELERFPQDLGLRLVTRLKLLAGMDISERRLPQDGRITSLFEEREIDIRVASIPTAAGEKIALRLFDREARGLNISELGFPLEIQQALIPLLHASSGFFVVCGPTGSGKTTALYAMLEMIDRDRFHLCSVEDPIERLLDGVTQVPINPRAGVTFANALRALLRQDPDVLLVGEIRDDETAVTAVGAALSGQMVLSTVHGADAARALERLFELGVKRSTIAGALSGILSLRLIRRLCVACKEASTTPDSVMQPRGCERCAQTGYRGRLALADLLIVDDAIRAAIAEGRISEKMRNEAIFEQAVSYVRNGETSLDELTRLSRGAFTVAA